MTFIGITLLIIHTSLMKDLMVRMLKLDGGGGGDDDDDDDDAMGFQSALFIKPLSTSGFLM